jgi:hypothetical protein
MLRRFLIVFFLALALAPAANAAGGRYVFDGGTRSEQAQVTAALNASSFDWNIVRGTVVIQIARNVSPSASPGQIRLDAGLLDSGRFAWGVVQHEYAHQIDFTVLTDAMRAQLAAGLGGASWWGSVGNHSQLTSERFADLVSWAYWASPANVMQPGSSSDEGGQMTTVAFRSLLANVLQLQPVRTVAYRKG